MKRNPCYELKEIAGHYYLLPFGQAAAYLQFDMEVNEVGAFIWRCLEKDVTPEDIVKACLEEYECSDDDVSRIDTVVKKYIDMLDKYKLLIYGQELLEGEKPYGIEQKKISRNECEHVITGLLRNPGKYSHAKYYTIAGINICIKSDCPIELKLMEAFEVNAPMSGIGQTIYISSEEEEDALFFGAGKSHLALTDDSTPGALIIDSAEVTAIQTDYGFRFEYADYIFVKSMHISDSGKEVILFHKEGSRVAVDFEIFQALRNPFLFLAQEMGIVAVHSASILYKGKAVLFSAKAQTGKSTHSNFWREKEKVDVLNGDVNLLGVMDSLVYVYGTPWCGTSGIYTDRTVPLGAVVFLKQGEENQVIEISEDSKVTKLSRRILSPVWTKEQLEKRVEIAKRIADNSLMCEYYCVNNNSAVYKIRDYIDNM